MNETPTNTDGTSRTGLVAVGVGALAVLCCAGAPLVVALLGGIALGSVLGIAAGVVAAIGLSAVVVVRTRRRRARAGVPFESRRQA